MISGQNNYIPFIGQNKYWIFSQQDDWEPVPNTIDGFIFSFGPDTIINDIVYSKLIKFGLDGENPCPNRPCFSPFIPYQINTNFQEAFAYLREDTIAKKVYCIPANNFFNFCDTNEHVLYDFNQNVGDTLSKCNLLFHAGWPLTENYFKIDSINMEFIFDKNRKVAHFNGFTFGGLPFIRPMKLVEGVGFVDNLGFYLDNYTKFGDFCEGTLEDCNIISKTKEYTKSKNLVSVFPNPASEVLNIESELNIQKTEIIDRNGRLVISSSGRELDVSLLLAGLYFVKCYVADKKLYYSKFVKM